MIFGYPIWNSQQSTGGTSGGASTVPSELISSEDLSINNLVNIFDDQGIIKVQKASGADIDKPAHGYVLDSVTAGNTVLVYLEGIIGGVNLTTGSPYYLSATLSGQFDSVIPSTVGHHIQQIGFAISSTELKFQRVNAIKVL